MQRFKTFAEVIMGSRVIFDNSIGIVKDLEKALLVGDILETRDSEKVLVAFKISNSRLPVEVELPYYLCQ